MEEKLGRKLKRGETVHHLDGDRSNNNIDNLYLYKSNGQHSREHFKGKSKEEISLLSKGISDH